MSRFKPSIRGKVNHTYYFGISLVVVIALLNYFNLTKLNRKVEFSFVITELFDTTLEIRRYEKNYFLYGHEEDYYENLRFVESAEDIVNRNRESIKRLVIEGYIYSLERDIKEYKSLIRKHFEADKDKMPDSMNISYIEEMIREKGKKIVDTAETISTAERQYIQSLISTTKKTLIVSGIFLVIMGFLIAEYLYRMVIKPLGQLEDSMQKISSGEFSLLPALSHDKEILSLVRAFNMMLLELEVRQSHLVQAEKLASLGTLLFGVAHELNNPLCNISTSCQILREEIEAADTEFKKELLYQIESETDRARDIVRSILDYSKAGKREMINIGNVVRETIGFIRTEIPPKIEIALDIPQELTVFADPQQLKQVFLNLIKNSIEAMDGEGAINISARSHYPTAEIRVSDTGKGMSQDMLSKIFDPFFTTKEGIKGYGLGLFVTHNIIKEHGGTIDVESAMGQGTTFLIKLPVQESL